MRRGQWLLGVAFVAALLVPAGASAQYVFYTDTNYPAPALRRCSPTGTGSASRALPAGTLPEGLAYDALHNKLYWAEAAFSGARIRTTDAGLGAGTTVLAGLGSLRGIAVDGAGGWLYWTSSDQGTGATINRAHLDGSGRQVLFLLPGFNPRSIAIDAAGSQLYWTEFEFDAIARCALDGSTGQFFAFLPIGARPYGIAIDPGTRELWWSEYGTGLVQSMALPAAMTPTTASSVELDLAKRSAALMAAARERAAPFRPAAVVSGLVNPTYLALDIPGSRLFVTQAGAGVTALRRANLDGSGLTTLPVTQASFGGVAWYGSSLVDVPDTGPPPVAAVALSLRAENPARGSAVMEFALPAEGDVTLDVLDAAGRRIASLAGGRHAAGVHRLTWTGETQAGHVAPGMYVLRLQADGRQLTRRFALLK